MSVTRCASGLESSATKRSMSDNVAPGDELELSFLLFSKQHRLNERRE